MRRLGISLAFALPWLSACGDIVPSSLDFVGVIPEQPRLGAVTVVQFLAQDQNREPMAGVSLEFAVEGGNPSVELLTATGMTNKGTGIAETQIRANSGVASVVVVATAAGGIVARSPPITFAGAATPNGKQLTFQCGTIAGAASGGMHAIQVFDEARNMIAGVKLECIAHVADRNGDGIPGALVSFLTEAGTIGPSATSVSDVIGNASVLYKTSYPLPAETNPLIFDWNPVRDQFHTGELVAPLWMEPWSWRDNPISGAGTVRHEPRRTDPIRSPMQLNPRDNLVTLIAVTTGEEGYWDENNNGAYDTGEPWDDLTEPFVDTDDDGTRNPTERWVDTNGNRTWDGKNTRHDSNTLIWTAERILWTGMPDEWDYNDPVAPTVRTEYPAGTFVEHGLWIPVHSEILDPWFNLMAADGEGDSCSFASADRPIVYAIPSKIGGGGPTAGIHMTYPSLSVIDFAVQDVHDISKNPPDNPYPRPVAFSMPLWCTSTGSPIAGFQYTVVISVNGTVQ